MAKIWFLILFTCVCAFSQAQVNYYNKTIDIDTVHNGFHGIVHYNGDTVLINGFLRDQSNKRYRTFSYIDVNSGDTITSFKYGRDTIDIYGGNTIDMCIVGNEIFACGAYYKDGKTFANILKFSIDGELLLDSLYYKEFEWTEFDCIISTNDGNFLLVGSKETIPGNLDAWLVKMDSNGNILWEKIFDYSIYDGAVLIAAHQNNFLISAGKSDLITGEIDLWLILVDSLGEIVWEKTYGGPYYDGGGARPLTNGEIHVSGTREYSFNKKESYVMRLDGNGELIWQKSLFKMSTSNAPSDLSFFSELVDGSIVLGGTSYEHDTPFDYPIARLYKMDNNGDSLWTRILKIRNNDNYPTCLQSLENGDIMIIGFVFPDSPDNTQDGWIMRTNCLGYFEPPKDSIVFEGNGVILQAQNFSTYFEYVTIVWGDGVIDTLYEGALQSLNHTYPFPGNYIISTSTVACNDTIKKTIEYTANPPNLSEQNLMVFPNPNDGNFQVWLNSEENYRIQVFDLNGRIVFVESDVNLNSVYSLDLFHVESAVYILKVSSDNSVYQTRVLVTK